MKKSIFLVLSVGACLAGSLCFSACDLKGQGGVKADAYKPLNEMIQADYSGIGITVTDTFGGGAVLTSVYTVSFADGAATVEYEAERFAEITPGGVPSGSVVKRTGKATVKEGQVTHTEGDDIGLTVSGKLFEFKEEYFADADLTEMYLKADVKDPEGFMGVKGCTAMHVDATFMDYFYGITVAYTAAGGDSVEIVYTFTL